MKLRIERVPYEQKHIIKHLMQFYLYDFTEFLNIPLAEDGRFPPYPDLAEYWSSGDAKLPFVFRRDDVPTGFALIDHMEDSSECDFYMAEFFVLRPFRRDGIGTYAAQQLFRMMPGRWKVTQVKSNVPAQLFWRKTVDSFTDGNYKERTHPWKGNTSQYFMS